MINEKKPSLMRIIQVDYPAFLAAIFPPLIWAFYLFDALRGNPASVNFLYTLLAITAGSLAVLAWRYSAILSFFDNGVESQATINEVGFFRGRGRVAFVYRFQGQKYLTSSMVMKTKRTECIQPGECMVILLMPDNPKRAILRDLYI
jgi:hypothetical protein